MKTYKTQCNRCGKTYETEIEWYSYICDQCKQKIEEEKKQLQRKYDEYKWEQLRQEMEEAIASGAPREEIDEKTRLYNEWTDYMFDHYATSTRDQK